MARRIRITPLFLRLFSKISVREEIGINYAIDFQINNFIPLSAGPEGEIRVRRTWEYIVEDFER